MKAKKSLFLTREIYHHLHSLQGQSSSTECFYFGKLRWFFFPLVAALRDTGMSFISKKRTKAGWCLQSQWWFKRVVCNLMCFIKSKKPYRKVYIKGQIYSRWKEAKNTDNRNNVPLNQWPTKHIWQCQRLKKNNTGNNLYQREKEHNLEAAQQRNCRDIKSISAVQQEKAQHK